MAKGKKGRKETATQRYRRLVLGQIRKLEKQGARFGGLKEEVKGMGWRELKKLYSPNKSGKRGTYKGLKEYAQQVDKEVKDIQADYESRGYSVDPDTGEIKPMGGGYQIMAIIEQMLTRLEGPVPTRMDTARGGTMKRSPWDIEHSETGRVTILDILKRRIAELGYEELGWALQPYATAINNLLDRMLAGYSDMIINATSELADLLNGESVDLDTKMQLGENEGYEDEEF